MADYSLDVSTSGSIDSTLHGLDKMDTKIHVPEVVKTDATVHVPEVVKADSTVHVPEVVKGDGTVHVPEPVTVDSNVDVKPMAVDTCVRLVLGPVPPTQVRSPWEQRVSLNLLGVELFSVAVAGELSTYLEPVKERPTIVGDIDAQRQHRGHDHGRAEHESSYLDTGRGLEIRLG